MDKHRRPPLAFLNVATIDINKLRIPPKQTVSITINQGPLERGAELIRVTHEDVDVDFNPIFNVAFGDVAPIENNGVMDVFRAMNVAVLDVAAKLEPFILK